MAEASRSHPSQYVRLNKDQDASASGPGLEDIRPGELNLPVIVPQLRERKCTECGQVLPPDNRALADEPWTTGIFGCAEDPESCWTGLFCPCVLFGRNVQALSEDIPWTLPCICHAVCVEGDIALAILTSLFHGVDPDMSIQIGESLVHANDDNDDYDSDDQSYAESGTQRNTDGDAETRTLHDDNDEIDDNNEDDNNDEDGDNDEDDENASTEGNMSEGGVDGSNGNDEHVGDLDFDLDITYDEYQQETLDRHWEVMAKTFRSEGEAYMFYNQYAKDRGFSIRRDLKRFGKVKVSTKGTPKQNIRGQGKNAPE
ncbi:cell number regulator 6 [Hordeum vulgare]|nr:cell number regulator 6 [Hordeum vulgare]